MNLDKENMLDLLRFFPRQCLDALSIGKKSEIKKSYRKRYSHIVFTGLGGSAIGGDIIEGYVGYEAAIPIFVNRNYSVPEFVNRESLVFASSYSGNTEETLSAYADAKEKHANIIVTTSGGKLKELAIRNGDALVTIPAGYPPRCALGYSFVPAVILLSRLGIIKDKGREIKRAADFLEGLERKRLGPNVKGPSNISKLVARKLHKRIAAVYASVRMQSVATRWRGEFAENAKTLSSSHVLPEMNHNEIVGWVNPRNVLKNFTAVMLRDKDDHPRIKRRMEITKSILEKEKFDVLEIESIGTSFLERMLSLVYIGDFASFYLALLYGIDPTPVERITYLKKRLAE